MARDVVRGTGANASGGVAMRLLDLGSVHLQIPEGWTVFRYQDVTYRLDKFGNWVVDRRAKVTGENNSVSREKRA